jgi:hypothetical protein
VCRSRRRGGVPYGSRPPQLRRGAGDLRSPRQLHLRVRESVGRRRTNPVSAAVRRAWLACAASALRLREGSLFTGHDHTDQPRSSFGSPPDGGAPSTPANTPGAPLGNPFPPGSYVVDVARSVFDQFAATAAGLSAADRLVAMRTMIDQLEGLWLAATADFSESGELAESGHRSLASWMRDRCRLAPQEANGRAKVALAVTDSQPLSGRAMRWGSLSWRHALVIDQVLRRVPVGFRAEAEKSLVEHAQSLDPNGLRRLGDRLVHCFDRERADEAAIRRLERRGLTFSETIDGTVSVSGLLDPVNGAALITAVNTRCRPPRSSVTGDHGDGHQLDHSARQAERDTRSWPQRRADALADICSEWLGHLNTSTVGGARPHLSVIVDVSSLAAGGDESHQESSSDGHSTSRTSMAEPAQLAWVGPITARQAQLIGCDSTVSRVVMDGPSQVIDVGRATRTISAALRRAVIARDRTCVGVGCHQLPEHCDVHHIVFWEHGGETSLANTVLLCRHHHRLVHLEQWRVTIDTVGRRRVIPPC